MDPQEIHYMGGAGDTPPEIATVLVGTTEEKALDSVSQHLRNKEEYQVTFCGDYR